MTFDQIEKFVSAQIDDVTRFRTDALRGTMQGAERTFPLFVYRDGLFVVMAFIPLTRLPKDTKRATQVAAWCLHKNAEEGLTKFSVDEDGDVILSIEMLERSLTEKQLERLLKILRRTANNYWKSLKKVV